MGKGKKTSKLSASQKLDLFWQSIRAEKLAALREGLVNTAIEAHTRTQEEPQLTSIMLAASLGKARSLGTLLDWYERRKPLRPKGWINLQDYEQGRTALHMAVGGGHLACVKCLLEKGANIEMKDSNDMTARDIAVKYNKKDILAMIDEFLKEESEEEFEEDEVDQDGLTRKQRAKLNKANRKEEQNWPLGLSKSSENSTSDSVKDPQSHLASSIRKKLELSSSAKPIWPEVERVIESVKNLQALHEISIVRTKESELEEEVKEHPGCIDPALWSLHTINRLVIQFPPSVLTFIPGDGLSQLRGLQVLVLNNNSLESLPDEIGSLSELRVLECEFNQIQSLPQSMASLSNLQTVNIANNQLESIAVLSKLKSLSVLNASRNVIRSLEDVEFSNWSSRLNELALSENQIEEFPPTIGLLSSLHTLEAEGNRLATLPSEMGKLKKLKVLKLDDNLIKDSKILKYLKGGNKGLKDLWKYLEKNASRKPNNQSGGGKKSKKKKQDVQEEEDDASHSEDATGNEEFQKNSSQKETQDDSDSSLDLDDDDI